MSSWYQWDSGHMFDRKTINEKLGVRYLTNPRAVRVATEASHHSWLCGRLSDVSFAKRLDEAETQWLIEQDNAYWDNVDAFEDDVSSEYERNGN